MLTRGQHSLVHRLLWFVALWLAGVSALSAVGLLIRSVLH
jgi:hypothetical protein